jgi:hypothetical protein
MKEALDDIFLYWELTQAGSEWHGSLARRKHDPKVLSLAWETHKPAAQMFMGPRKSRKVKGLTDGAIECVHRRTQFYRCVYRTGTHILAHKPK